MGPKAFCSCLSDLLLIDAVTNSSKYAVAFHTAPALQQGVSSKEIDAIRERRFPTDKRFAALSTLAKTLIEKRGHLSERELDSFIAAGFTNEQVVEVIALEARLRGNIDSITTDANGCLARSGTKTSCGALRGLRIVAACS